MTHPLTYEICDQIQDSPYPINIEDMRAAADWQLERVVEWLEDVAGYDLIYPNDCDNMIQHLKKAMRPQQQQEDNS